jgi:hypothetical protein
MAFNPTLPQTNSLQSSAEMRAQFTGLKDLLDALPASSPMSDAITNQVAGMLSGVSPLALSVSNPPTQAQVQAIANRLDLLITALKTV